MYIQLYLAVALTHEYEADLYNLLKIHCNRLCFSVTLIHMFRESNGYDLNLHIKHFRDAQNMLNSKLILIHIITIHDYKLVLFISSIQHNFM